MMEEVVENLNIVKRPHHNKKDLCTSRLPYRQGKKLTAVKVYTVNEESQHLIIRGVPALKLQKELKNLCLRYGDIKIIHAVPNYAENEEAFTEVFHVCFVRIQSARFAKHMIDDKNFFGGVLHVCYAPELESFSETNQKLITRRKDVLRRINLPDKQNQMLPVQFLSETETQNTNEVNITTSKKEQSNYKVTFAEGGLIEQTFIPYNSDRTSKAVHDNYSNSVPWKANKQAQSTQRRKISGEFIPSNLKRIRFNISK